MILSLWERKVRKKINKIKKQNSRKSKTGRRY